VDVPDGMSIPDELARREERLRRLAAARAKIPARAQGALRARAGRACGKLAAREAKTRRPARSGGRPPRRRSRVPCRSIRSTADEDSRSCRWRAAASSNGYNAQAAVAADSLLVIAADVGQAPNDKQQLAPMGARSTPCRRELGEPETLLAEHGYSARQCARRAAAGIEPLIAAGRQPHHPSLTNASRGAAGGGQSDPGRSHIHRLQTADGKKLYALRKQTRSRCSASSSRFWVSVSFCCAARQRRGEWSL